MAAKTTRKKSDATQCPIPQNIEEAAHFVAEIGRARRSIKTFERSLNERQAALKEEFAGHIKPHQERMEQLFAGLKMWAEVNRQALCQDGLKSRHLPTGTIMWRLTPQSVALKNVAEVIAELKAAGLDRFLRRKVEVDKEAILGAPDEVKGIPGISFVQREEFIVEPAEDELEMPRTKETVGREEVTL